VSLFFRSDPKHSVPRPKRKKPQRGLRFRSCRLELMESRQLLSASIAPIHLAATYFEDSNETDTASVLEGASTPVADLFEVSYTGGADGTQLASLTINLKNTFFDTTAGGDGAYGYFPLTILSQQGISITSKSVSDGGTTLTMTFSGFDAGEKLVFSIDVDENGNLEPNAVVEGAELEGATLSASFTAPYTAGASVSGSIFYDDFEKHYPDYDTSAVAALLPNEEYDNAVAEDYMPSQCSPGPVYTALAYATVQQSYLPITLSGTVYYDKDADNVQDAGEKGISGVTLTLYVLDGDAYVATGRTATTNADGEYSFTDLDPGTYKVVETQPDGYSSVGDTPGTVDGVTRGEVVTVDILGDIVLYGGDDSVRNDFAEIIPASVSGYVYVDANNNGVFDAGETPIEGVTLTLTSGDIGATATTNSSGYYSFTDLMPGTYIITEAQPNGYLDGLDAAGSAGGMAANPGDQISAIPLAAGVAATHYDFGELLPASISGRVFADMDNDGTFSSGDKVLSGVTVYLLDSTGTRIDSTTTDAKGKYSFTDLEPGVYGVEEIQPDGYLEGGDQVGTAGGSLDGVDRILAAQLDANVHGLNYDFWEIVPATISGYVFQDGPTIEVAEGQATPDIPSVRDGTLTPDDTRLAGVTLVLCEADGTPILQEGQQITTVTDADGYYEFTGLYPGQYSVLEVMPDGYETGIDTAGSAGGIVVNEYSNVNSQTLSTLAVTTADNAIVRIAVFAGDSAVNYNFSHVLVTTYTTPPPPSPPPPSPPPPSPPLAPPAPQPYVEPQILAEPYYLMPEVVRQWIAGGAGGLTGYSWHLSIIDAGQPRQESLDNVQMTQVSWSPYFDPISWSGANMDQAQWLLADENGTVIREIHFGMAKAAPVVGDWDGSGTVQVGVFIDGLWFIDLNGNGIWDKGDLWVKLGRSDDQPVTGDWNGDGKTDVGIFGPMWVGDPRAIAAEPGLPDSQNPPASVRPKNVPPDPTEATTGYRTLKKGNAGKMRSDLIDHVFEYGADGDVAVTGDWNGDGIYTIGVFRKGTWFLDMDGDGRWSPGDLAVEFGQDGDLPVVGDWTGQGTSKLGVYRNGRFYLDTAGTHKMADAKMIRLGRAGDHPVAGDWTGNGIDKVGVYHDSPAPSVPLQARK
jgi:serine-aspartate repeat-containing protein C/D/E